MALPVGRRLLAVGSSTRRRFIASKPHETLADETLAVSCIHTVALLTVVHHSSAAAHQSFGTVTDVSTEYEANCCSVWVAEGHSLTYPQVTANQRARYAF